MVTLKTVEGRKIVEISVEKGKVSLPVRDARLLGLELIHITAGGDACYCNDRTDGAGCRACG